MHANRNMGRQVTTSGSSKSGSFSWTSALSASGRFCRFSDADDAELLDEAIGELKLFDRARFLDAVAAPDPAVIPFL